jgi:hypothetical protein
MANDSGGSGGSTNKKMVGVRTRTPARGAGDMPDWVKNLIGAGARGAAVSGMEVMEGLNRLLDPLRGTVNQGAQNDRRMIDSARRRLTEPTAQSQNDDYRTFIADIQGAKNAPSSGSDFGDLLKKLLAGWKPQR